MDRLQSYEINYFLKKKAINLINLFLFLANKLIRSFFFEKKTSSSYHIYRNIKIKFSKCIFYGFVQDRLSLSK